MQLRIIPNIYVSKERFTAPLPVFTYNVKYGSYSSFLRSEKVAQKKAQRSITTADVIKIGIAIIFGISTAVLGWLNYTDNQKIDKITDSIH
jgi:uncharacterized membrane protein